MDPLGRAIAWLAPGFGAACIGYAVRQGDDEHGPWRQIFRSGEPRTLHDTPLCYGCALLGPTPNDPKAAKRAHWRFVERDPTAAVCAAQCDTVQLALSARLDDDALHLTLLATNGGASERALELGLRFCFAEGFHLSNTHDDTPCLYSDDGAMQLILHAIDGIAPRWQITTLAGGGLAVAAHTTAAPGAMIAPGAVLRLGIVISSR